jgi:hypothetical protein
MCAMAKQFDHPVYVWTTCNLCLAILLRKYKVSKPGEAHTDSILLIINEPLYPATSHFTVAAYNMYVLQSTNMGLL